MHTGPRGHRQKFDPKLAITKRRKKSFALRTVAVWNSLIKEAVLFKSLRIFKKRLDKLWEGQKVLYQDFTGKMCDTTESSREEPL